MLRPGIWFPSTTSMIVDFNEYIGHPLALREQDTLDIVISDDPKVLATCVVEFVEEDEFWSRSEEWTIALPFHHRFEIAEPDWKG